MKELRIDEQTLAKLRDLEKSLSEVIPRTGMSRVVGGACFPGCGGGCAAQCKVNCSADCLSSCSGISGIPSF